MYSVCRDLPPGIMHLAIFWTRFVQHGIGVVDVDVDFARTPKARQNLQTSFRTRDRHMPHFPGRRTASFYAQQFVVDPECSVEKEQVRGIEPLKQLVVNPRNRRQRSE